MIPTIRSFISVFDEEWFNANEPLINSGSPKPMTDAMIFKGNIKFSNT